MLETIENPSDRLFLDLVKESKKNIYLCSPFIKTETVRNILATKDPYSDLEVLTSSRPSNYQRGSSDVEAIKLLVDSRYTVRNLSNLHAKIYIFDRKKALVTSSNLTDSGFNHNFEYGLLISDDDNTVTKIYHDYYDIAHSKECGVYDSNNIEFLEKLAKGLSKSSPSFVEDKDKDEIAHIEDLGAIIGSLSGWIKDVFDCLDRLPGQYFDAKDVKSFVPLLQRYYPKNHTVDASLRRNLQELRDLGLIRFIDNGGHYKKLWN